MELVTNTLCSNEYAKVRFSEKSHVNGVLVFALISCVLTSEQLNNKTAETKMSTIDLTIIVLLRHANTSRVSGC